MSLLTSLLSFIFGLVLAYLAHVLSLSRVDREFRLRKLDELYSLCYVYCDASFFVTDVIAVGQWQDNETLLAKYDKWKLIADESRVSINRIYDIYFSQMKPRFEELTNLLIEHRRLKVDYSAGVEGQNQLIGHQMGDKRKAIDGQLQLIVNDIRENADLLRRAWPML